MIANRRHRVPTRRGITLLEVLLALAIFLLSLGAVYSLVNIGSERALDAAIQNTGARLAQSKLAEVEAGVISPASGGSGTFETDADWNWSVESGTSPAANLYPVTVRVWKMVGGQRREVVMTQMIYDADQMGSSVEAAKPTTSTSSSGSSGGSTP